MLLPEQLLMFESVFQLLLALDFFHIIIQLLELFILVGSDVLVSQFAVSKSFHSASYLHLFSVDWPENCVRSVF